MLKDTYFSMITSKNSNVEFWIVAVTGLGNHKQNILDHYNKGVKFSNMVSILKFSGNIGDNINGGRLILTNGATFEDLKSFLKDNLPDELIPSKFINILIV